MRKNLLVSSLLLCVATLFGSQAAFASENWLGSWKLNVEKSNFTSENVTRAQTLKFEAMSTGIKLTTEGADPQGKPMQGEYTSNYDGKDVPWTGNPSADMACAKRIDDNSYENVWKMGGKPTGAHGAAASSVAVYDRQ
jgi:hypothetical protein